MSFLTASLWGVKVWIWLYLIISIVLLLVVIIILFREQIRKQYYKIRFPQRLLKVVIHYKTGYFNVYWRIIPDLDTFNIAGHKYAYDEKSVVKDKELFVKKRDKFGEGHIVIDGKSYKIEKLMKIKNRWESWPELHYFYNVPNPIKFDYDKKKIPFTSKQLKTFKENDLFTKLLTLDNQNNLMFICIIASALSAIISFVILARDLGWIG